MSESSYKLRYNEVRNQDFKTSEKPIRYTKRRNEHFGFILIFGGIVFLATILISTKGKDISQNRENMIDYNLPIFNNAQYASSEFYKISDEEMIYTTNYVVKDFKQVQYSEPFSIGSSKEQVIKAQGNPTSIYMLEAGEGEVWNYEYSKITFEKGRVTKYANVSKNLNVQ